MLYALNKEYALISEMRLITRQYGIYEGCLCCVECCQDSKHCNITIKLAQKVVMTLSVSLSAVAMNVSHPYMKLLLIMTTTSS